MEYYDKSEYLAHYGILGMKWGVRRFQNTDGSLTSAGRNRYGIGEARKAVSEWISTKKKERTRAKALKKAAKIRKEKAKEKEALEKEQKEIDRLKRETDAINARTNLLKAKIAEKEARRESRRQMLPGVFRKDSKNQQVIGDKNGGKKGDRTWLGTVDLATKAGVAAIITNSLKNRFTYEREKGSASSDAASKKEEAIKEQANTVPYVPVADLPSSTTSSGSAAIEDIFWNLDINYDD